MIRASMHRQQENSCMQIITMVVVTAPPSYHILPRRIVMLLLWLRHQPRVMMHQHHHLFHVMVQILEMEFISYLLGIIFNATPLVTTEQTTVEQGFLLLFQEHINNY